MNAPTTLAGPQIAIITTRDGRTVAENVSENDARTMHTGADLLGWTIEFASPLIGEDWVYTDTTLAASRKD